MSTEPEELSGQTIGPYTVGHLVGQGGFAWVYAGRRTADEYPVALKVLQPRYAGDPEFEARFRTESEAAASMKHPNVVNIIEVGRAGGYTYHAMDLYPDSLASLLKRSGPLTENQLIPVAQDIVRGLHYAHESGVIHRDLKVDNVLLRADGSAVIADFGLSRLLAGYASATGVDMTIGTPQYISPEQAQGRTMDGRSDLYSLGVTLYRAATGEAPFHSTDWYELARMHVEDRPPPPRTLRPELSARFERVILKCLAKHPNDRYESAASLLHELDDLGDASRATETFGAPPISTGEVLATGAKPRPRWLIVVLAVLVVVAVAYLVVLFGG